MATNVQKIKKPPQPLNPSPPMKQKSKKASSPIDQVVDPFKNLSTEDKATKDKATQYNATEELKRVYEKLKEKLNGREEKKIDKLCHVTNKTNKKAIERDGQLKGNSTGVPTSSPLKTNSDIKGVWFITSLYQGGLPTQSPYGKERIQIPISGLIENGTIGKWKLFYESTYYYKNGIQYVRLVLGNEHNRSTYDSLTWCEKNLHKIVITDNPFFCWKDGYMNVITYEPGEASVYVEVLILGDMDIPKWDTVEKTGTTTAHSISGLCDMLD